MKGQSVGVRYRNKLGHFTSYDSRKNLRLEMFDLKSRKSVKEFKHPRSRDVWEVETGRDRWAKKDVQWLIGLAEASRRQDIIAVGDLVVGTIDVPDIMPPGYLIEEFTKLGIPETGRILKAYKLTFLFLNHSPLNRYFYVFGGRDLLKKISEMFRGGMSFYKSRVDGDTLIKIQVQQVLEWEEIDRQAKIEGQIVSAHGRRVRMVEADWR